MAFGSRIPTHRRRSLQGRNLRGRSPSSFADERLTSHCLKTGGKGLREGAKKVATGKAQAPKDFGR